MYHRKKYSQRLTIIGKRSLACFVALCMLFSFAPTVFAEGIELTEEVITNIISEVTETEAAEEVTALSEITEMRDEFSKTFLMSDGTYTQVSYASPVHYEDEDGVFQEIDNRLSVNAMTGKVTTGNGGTDVAFSQSQPQVSINANGHNISWSVEKKNELRNDDNVSLMNITPSYASFTANAINVADTADFKALPVEEQLMSAHKAFSEMKYASFAEGYAVNYTVAPGKVKEDILITSAENNEFVITVNAMGLTAVLGDYRTVIFKNNANETVLTFDVPYMYDANDEFSTNIDIALTPVLGGYEITLTADEEWLNDEARVYPVVIDPSYTFEHGSTPATTITDTMVHEGDSATDCSCGVDHDAHGFVITNKYNSKQYYSYFKVEVNSSAAMSRVIEATLNLHLTSTTNSGGPFSLYRVTQDWDEATITYDNQPSHSNTAVDSGINYVVNSNGTVTVTFDIAEEVRRYTAGIYENYGFMLAYTNEDINDYNRFHTANYETVAHRPTMTVNYDFFVTREGEYSNYCIENIGNYKILTSSTSPVQTQPYNPSNIHDFAWTVIRLDSYCGYCVIRPSDDASRALRYDGTTVSVANIGSTNTLSAVPEECQWNIFEYNSYYVLRNKATGKILSSSDTTVNGVSKNSGSLQRWNINFVPCMSMSADNIVAVQGETIPYSSINLTFNEGGIQPTLTTQYYIYTPSCYPEGSVSFGTNGMTVSSDFAGGEIKVTFGRIDTTATAEFSVFVIPDGGVFIIENQETEMYMNIGEDSDGTYVVQHAFNDADLLYWQTELQSDGYYKIKNLKTGRYLKVAGDSSANNQTTKVYDDNLNTDGYKFKFEITNSGTIKILPKTGEASSRYLATESGNNGAKIRQMDDENASNEWALYCINNLQLNTPKISQRHQWCWAASALMMTRTFVSQEGDDEYIKRSADQRAAVYHVFGDDSIDYTSYDWKKDPDELKNKGGIHTDVADAAAYLAGESGKYITFSATLTPYDEKYLIRFLIDGCPITRLCAIIDDELSSRPTIIGAGISLLFEENDGHTTVIKGVYWDETQQRFMFTINDPDGGSSYDLLYEELLFNVDNGRSEVWYPTVVVKTGYSDHIDSRDYSSQP